MAIVAREHVNNSRAEVGQRLREWRHRRNLSQATVAAAIGLTQATLSNYESGKRELPIAAAIRIAEHLDVPLGELYDVPDTIVPKRSRLAHALSALVDHPDILDALSESMIVAGPPQQQLHTTVRMSGYPQAALPLAPLGPAVLVP